MRLLSSVVFTIVLAGALRGEVAVRGSARRSIVAPPHSIVAAPQAMRSSGLIFSGTVLEVEHIAPAGSPAITQITFRVESAIRGTRRGQVITIHEWAGLWNSGERYRAGERVLLFLYPRSKLGLTSPVGGSLGRYQVDQSGRVLLQGVAGRPRPVRLQDFTAAIRRERGDE
jgi:hypothetical protein